MWRQPKQVQWWKDQYNKLNQIESILDNTLVETVNDHNVIMDSCRNENTSRQPNRDSAIMRKLICKYIDDIV